MHNSSWFENTFVRFNAKTFGLHIANMSFSQK